MAKSLRELGRRVDLTSNLVTYCLRRGAAYLLAMNCKDEERCARMEHNPKDHISTQIALWREMDTLLHHTTLKLLALVDCGATANFIDEEFVKLSGDAVY